jgi:hypothetical protein
MRNGGNTHGGASPPRFCGNAAQRQHDAENHILWPICILVECMNSVSPCPGENYGHLQRKSLLSVRITGSQAHRLSVTKRSALTKAVHYSLHQLAA